MNQEGQNTISSLITRGKVILQSLQQATNQQKVPDIVSIAAPFFLEDDDAKEVQGVMDSWKSLAGLGPLREPLNDYIEWYNQCDHYFTRERCRTDRRAKRFGRLRKQLGKLMNQSISSDEFLLSVKEQISLLESIEKDPKKKKSKTRRTKTDDKQEKPVGEFVLRKVIQAVILGVVVVGFTMLVTLDLLTIGQAFGIVVSFHLLAALFQFPQDRVKGNSTSEKVLKSLLLASYVLVFSASSYQLISMIYTVDITFFLLLVASLFITEIVVRRGRIELIQSAAEYVERILTVVLFVGIAYGLSLIIGQPIWIGLSILAALWAVWKNTQE